MSVAAKIEGQTGAKKVLVVQAMAMLQDPQKWQDGEFERFQIGFLTFLSLLGYSAILFTNPVQNVDFKRAKARRERIKREQMEKVKEEGGSKASSSTSSSSTSSSSTTSSSGYTSEGYATPGSRREVSKLSLSSGEVEVAVEVKREIPETPMRKEGFSEGSAEEKLRLMMAYAGEMEDHARWMANGADVVDLTHEVVVEAEEGGEELHLSVDEQLVLQVGVVYTFQGDPTVKETDDQALTRRTVLTYLTRALKGTSQEYLLTDSQFSMDVARIYRALKAEAAQGSSSQLTSLVVEFWDARALNHCRSIELAVQTLRRLMRNLSRVARACGSGPPVSEEQGRWKFVQWLLGVFSVTMEMRLDTRRIVEKLTRKHPKYTIADLVTKLKDYRNARQEVGQYGRIPPIRQPRDRQGRGEYALEAVAGREGGRGRGKGGGRGSHDHRDGEMKGEPREEREAEKGEHRGRGICYDYNSPGGCQRDPCRFNHYLDAEVKNAPKCGKCGKKFHTAKQCRGGAPQAKLGYVDEDSDDEDEAPVAMFAPLMGHGSVNFDERGNICQDQGELSGCPPTSHFAHMDLDSEMEGESDEGGGAVVGYGSVNFDEQGNILGDQAEPFEEFEDHPCYHPISHFAIIQERPNLVVDPALRVSSSEDSSSSSEEESSDERDSRECLSDISESMPHLVSSSDSDQEAVLELDGEVRARRTRAGNCIAYPLATMEVIGNGGSEELRPDDELRSPMGYWSLVGQQFAQWLPRGLHFGQESGRGDTGGNTQLTGDQSSHGDIQDLPEQQTQEGQCPPEQAEVEAQDRWMESLDRLPPESKLIRSAVLREVTGLRDHRVWPRAPQSGLDPTPKILSTKWVYTGKPALGPSGTAQFKARLVAMETPSQMEKIYTLQSAGYGMGGRHGYLNRGTDLQARQEAGAWRKYLDRLFCEAGFQPCLTDEDMYYAWTPDGMGCCFVATYADDLLPVYNVAGEGLRDRLWAVLEEGVEKLGILRLHEEATPSKVRQGLPSTGS